MSTVFDFAEELNFRATCRGAERLRAVRRHFARARLERPVSALLPRCCDASCGRSPVLQVFLWVRPRFGSPYCAQCHRVHYGSMRLRTYSGSIL